MNLTVSTMLPLLIGITRKMDDVPNICCVFHHYETTILSQPGTLYVIVGAAVRHTPFDGDANPGSCGNQRIRPSGKGKRNGNVKDWQ